MFKILHPGPLMDMSLSRLHAARWIRRYHMCDIHPRRLRCHSVSCLAQSVILAKRPNRRRQPDNHIRKIKTMSTVLGGWLCLTSSDTRETTGCRAKQHSTYSALALDPPS